MVITLPQHREGFFIVTNKGNAISIAEKGRKNAG